MFCKKTFHSLLIQSRRIRSKEHTSGITRSTTTLHRTYHHNDMTERAVFSDEIPQRDDFSRKACDTRRKWAEFRTGAKLSAIGQWLEEQDTCQLKGNIEVPMGTVKVPVAAIGPLRINGQSAKGDFIAPFATTEGALTASVMRGILGINAGSGVFAWTGSQHATRAPCFVTRSPQEAIILGKYVKSHMQRIQEEVIRNVSSHAVLEDIVPLYDMEAVHLLFQYSTGDAGGQNVATVCSWSAMNWIIQKLPKDLPGVGIEHAWVEANGTMDKKPGAINILTTRGMATQAKCVIPEEALNTKLQVKSDDYLAFLHYCRRMTAKNTTGGTLQINPGNVLTAMYMATGQDVACVTDSIAGVQFEVERNQGVEGGLTFSITFPSMIVGTVGGGTGLPTQQEGLAMLSCQGHGKVRKLAEIFASFALALDISTTTAVVAGKFVAGHEKLGRNRPQ